LIFLEQIESRKFKTKFGTAPYFTTILLCQRTVPSVFSS
jgi:hypothetical protein